MNQTPSYGEVQQAVDRQLGSGSAAEAHGLLAGLLCVESEIDAAAWIARLDSAASGIANERELGVLEWLFEDTKRQLDDFDFSFELLLPDDSNPLDLRAAALAEWCQGFLYGLGQATAGAEWPGDCAELLRDFAAIAQLDPVAGDESDEVAFVELREYVRVGVQVICSELLAGTPRNIH